MNLNPSELHFANTFFEIDLGNHHLSIEQALSLHPNFFQLQFLPLLYAKKQAFFLYLGQLTKDLKNGVNLSTLKEIPSPSIEMWGCSNCIDELKDSYSAVISNEISLSLIHDISSKLWSFPYLKKYVPQAEIIYTEKELCEFFEHRFFPCVLKNPQGFSSRGNTVILAKEKITELDYKKLKLQLTLNPLIVEPWLNRILDFSTQWMLTKTQIECLGTTLLVNSNRGSYMGNIFNPEDRFMLKTLEPIELHFQVVKPILKELQNLGFQGNLGVDAFFYQDGNHILLQPIVEINPRKTMGYVTLQLAENHRFESPIFLRLQKAQNCLSPLLPEEIIVHNKKINFKKNLTIETHPGVFAHASFENMRWNTFKWHY